MLSRPACHMPDPSDADARCLLGVHWQTFFKPKDMPAPPSKAEIGGVTDTQPELAAIDEWIDAVQLEAQRVDEDLLASRTTNYQTPYPIGASHSPTTTTTTTTTTTPRGPVGSITWCRFRQATRLPVGEPPPLRVDGAFEKMPRQH
jgi:hypothetical protein